MTKINYTDRSHKNCAYQTIGNKIIIHGIGNSYYGALRELHTYMSKKEIEGLQLGECTNKLCKYVEAHGGVACPPKKFVVKKGVVTVE